MTVTRINRFTAAAGSEDALFDLLQSITPLIEASDGCEAVKLLRRKDAPAEIVVIEEWASEAAHQVSAQDIPADLLETARTLLAGPPEGSYYA